MNRKYCDICEKEMKGDSFIQIFYNPPKSGTTFYRVVNKNVGKKIDACGDCINNFVELVSEFLSP